MCLVIQPTVFLFICAQPFPARSPVEHPRARPLCPPPTVSPRSPAALTTRFIKVNAPLSSCLKYAKIQRRQPPTAPLTRRSPPRSRLTGFEPAGRALWTRGPPMFRLPGDRPCPFRPEDFDRARFGGAAFYLCRGASPLPTRPPNPGATGAFSCPEPKGKRRLTPPRAAHRRWHRRDTDVIPTRYRRGTIYFYRLISYP